MARTFIGLKLQPVYVKWSPTKDEIVYGDGYALIFVTFLANFGLMWPTSTAFSFSLEQMLGAKGALPK